MKKIILAMLFLLCLFIQSSPQRDITLCFTGDIMLGRDVGLNIDRYGMEYPYEMVRDILKDADITFGNLECPLTSRDTPGKTHGILFSADIDNAAALKSAGYDILNLSNNHMMDYGNAGLDDTKAALCDNDLEYTGLCSTPTILERHGVRIGFIGYSEFAPNIDEDAVRVDIQKAGSCCDFLVVSFHFGSEYNPYPTENQKRLARLAVDCGAGLVVGHHPHVLQGIEKYKGKYIFYSLGNFIFDRQIMDGTDESVILKVKTDGNKVKDIEIIPVVIRRCRPETEQGEEKDELLEKLDKLSIGISPP